MELTGIHPPHLCGDITGMSQVREKGLTQGFQHLGTGSLCSQKAAGKKKKKKKIPPFLPKPPWIIGKRSRPAQNPGIRRSQIPDAPCGKPPCAGPRVWCCGSTGWPRARPLAPARPGHTWPAWSRHCWAGIWPGKHGKKKQGKGGKKGEGGGGGGRRGIAEEAEEERGGEGDAGELVELFWELSWVLFCVFWELSQLSWE